MFKQDWNHLFQIQALVEKPAQLRNLSGKVVLLMDSNSAVKSSKMLNGLQSYYNAFM